MRSRLYNELNLALIQYLSGKLPIDEFRDVHARVLWDDALAESPDAEQLAWTIEGRYAELTSGIIDESEFRSVLQRHSLIASLPAP